MQVFITLPDDIGVRNWRAPNQPGIKMYRRWELREREAIDENLCWRTDGLRESGTCRQGLDGIRGWGRYEVIDEERLAFERRLWQAQQILLPADQRREYGAPSFDTKTLKRSNE